MEEKKEISLDNINKINKSLSSIMDVKVISTSIIAVVAYIFYQFGYSFLYGFYFVEEPVNIISVISNPIPFNFKAVVAIGIISFVCLVTFVYANIYIRERSKKIVVKLVGYLLPTVYAFNILSIIIFVAKPQNSLSLLVQLLSYSYALNSIHILIYSVKDKRSPLIITSIIWTIIFMILLSSIFSIKITIVALLFIWSISVTFEDLLYAISEMIEEKGKYELLFTQQNKISLFLTRPLKDNLIVVCLKLVNYFKFFPLYFYFALIIADILSEYPIHSFIQKHIYVYIIVFTLMVYVVFCLLCPVCGFFYKKIKLLISRNDKGGTYKNSYIKEYYTDFFEGLYWFIMPILSTLFLIVVYYFMGQLGHFVGENSINDNISVITYSAINGSEKSIYGNIIAQDNQFYYIIGIPDQKLYVVKATHINSIPTNYQVLMHNFTINNSGKNGSALCTTEEKGQSILMINDKVYIPINDFFEILSISPHSTVKDFNISYVFKNIEYSIDIKDGIIKTNNKEIELDSMPITLNDVIAIPLEDTSKLMGVSIKIEKNNIYISY